jgi:acyl carrier protein
MNEKIKQVMARAFEVPEKKINDSSSQDNIETWDSLHHIKMIVFLEREFDIIIPDDKVGNMINYKLIELVVNECTKS